MSSTAIVKTTDIMDLPSKQPEAVGVGEMVSKSISQLRSETAAMVRDGESLRGAAQSQSPMEAAKAALAGTDTAAMQRRESVSANQITSQMPHRSDMDGSMTHYIGILENLGQMSNVTAMFTVGAAVATKADGSIKMFVQAQ